MGSSTHSYATSLCGSINGSLPLPRNSLEVAEFGTIMSLLGVNYRSKVILGISDNSTENIWLDQDGKNITFTYWSISQPNNVGQGGQDFASISYPGNKWGDWPSTMTGSKFLISVLIDQKLRNRNLSNENQQNRAC